MRIYLFMAAMALAGCKDKASDTRDQPAPDNTAKNKRDRATAPVADQAISAPGDLDLTKTIRSAVVADSSLSMDAHNCKIVVNDGTVTLVGPVKSVDERDRVQQIALAAVGGDGQKVVNKLEVLTN
jgi:osmotically-inducible protein OsmY